MKIFQYVPFFRSSFATSFLYVPMFRRFYQSEIYMHGTQPVNLSARGMISIEWNFFVLRPYFIVGNIFRIFFFCNHHHSCRRCLFRTHIASVLNSSNSFDFQRATIQFAILINREVLISTCYTNAIQLKHMNNEI